MATARCASCGRSGRWRARRGASLADQPCPGCGAPLAGPGAGRAAGPVHGCPWLTCLLCGARGRACVGGVAVLPGRAHVRALDLGRVEVPAGSAVCLAHPGVDELAPGVEECAIERRPWLWCRCYACARSLPGAVAACVTGAPLVLARDRTGLSGAVWVPAGALLCDAHGAPAPPAGPCRVLSTNVNPKGVLHVF